MHKVDDPRGIGREAVQKSVPPEIWKQNLAFTQEMVEVALAHPLNNHPILAELDKSTLNKDITRTLHLEFSHAFAQIFTDSLIHAMATSADLEQRLGPLGKVSARFLLQLNLLDELGYCASEKGGDEYTGNPYLAHYMQFSETLEQLGAKSRDILEYKPSAAAKAARRTFTDYFNDHVLLTGVLAVAETVFSKFAGPWAKSVGKSTDIDVSKGYHKIHVEDEHGSFVDDDHAEDSWYIFRQALTPDKYDEVRELIPMWLDSWNDFCDNAVHLARTLKK
ncbi:MAG: hypothetical protein ABL958_21525 [Bdellovibrionia bacterium]